MKPGSRAVRASDRSKLTGTIIGALGASILLASCSGAEPDPAPGVLTRSAAIASTVWEVDLEPIAQPKVSDGVALIYAKTADGLNAMAVSVADGKTLWSAPIHPGIGAPGVELEPALTKSASGASAAVFLEPAPAPADNGGITWWTRPVAVDLKTGQEIYRGDVQLVSSRPAACEDERDLCFTSMSPADGQSVEHRVDLDGGADLTGARVNPLVGNFRLVGDGGLYSVVDSGTESLARVSGGKKLWSFDVQAVFGPGAGTNFGWTFEYSRELDLFVGTVGSNPTGETDYAKLFEQGFTVDLATRRAAGFRASTGEILWTADGAETWCSSSLGTDATKLEGASAFPVRCEYTQGTVKLPAGSYENAMAKVVGYDPLTGKAAWQTEPQPVADIKELLVPTASRGDTVLTGSPDGRKLIDSENGSSRAVTAEDVFLCSRPATYPLPASPPFPVLPEGNLGSGGETAFPCHQDGAETQALSQGAVRDIGTVDGVTAVVAMAGKIAAYKLP